MPPTTSLAEEWDAGCRHAIRDNLSWCSRVMSSSSRAPCLFGDVQGCVPPCSISREGPFMPRFREVAKANFVSHQFCYEHNRQCQVLVRTDWETAGLPCVDYSFAGKRLQEDGPTATVFITHAKRHIQLGTPMILLENVQASGFLCEA